MPRGLSKIRQSNEASQARRAAYDASGPGLRKLRLDEGEIAKVRFLEEGDDVWSVYVHDLPIEQGQQYPTRILCLDQDNTGEGCPACARAKKRSERVVINLIWYGAPKFKRNAENRMEKDTNGNYIKIGVEDAVVTWETSVKNGGRLDVLNTKYEGLTANTFEIRRRGSGKATEYDIDFDAKLAPSAADGELYKSKPDPRKIIRSLSPGDMERVYSGGAVQSDRPQMGQGQPSGDEQQAASGAFAKQPSTAIRTSAFS